MLCLCLMHPPVDAARSEFAVCLAGAALLCRRLGTPDPCPDGSFLPSQPSPPLLAGLAKLVE